MPWAPPSSPPSACRTSPIRWRSRPPSEVCLLVVDGLGWELLRAHPAAAPFLSELAMNAAPLTAGFPSTTATSLTSLGTGRPPGQHGVLGYQVAIPGSSPLEAAQHAALGRERRPGQVAARLDRLRASGAAGVASYRVAPIALAATGLSRATTRGAEYLPGETLGALVSLRGPVRWRPTSTAVFTTVYYGDLDTTGHLLGCTSEAWLYQLAHVDKLVEQLASALPHGTMLLVTADHGMVNIAEADRTDADTVPGLRDGVILLGGEARVRHLYCADGAAAGCAGGLERSAGQPGLGGDQGAGDRRRLVRPRPRGVPGPDR